MRRNRNRSFRCLVHLWLNCPAQAFDNSLYSLRAGAWYRPWNYNGPYKAGTSNRSSHIAMLLGGFQDASSPIRYPKNSRTRTATVRSGLAEENAHVFVEPSLNLAHTASDSPKRWFEQLHRGGVCWYIYIHWFKPTQVEWWCSWPVRIWWHVVLRVYSADARRTAVILARMDSFSSAKGMVMWIHGSRKSD